MYNHNISTGNLKIEGNWPEFMTLTFRPLLKPEIEKMFLNVQDKLSAYIRVHCWNNFTTLFGREYFTKLNMDFWFQNTQFLQDGMKNNRSVSNVKTYTTQVVKSNCLKT